MRRCQPACPPPTCMGSIIPPPCREAPTTTAPPITADGPYPPIRIGFRAPLFRGGDQKGRKDGATCLQWRERERKKTQRCGDKHVQLVKPSMINFAKTDAEFRPGYALLILTTYKRIKKHLLSNWRVWINHRAILKGTLNSLSWQTWQFSLKWQMSSEERGPPAPSLPVALTYLPSQTQQRTKRTGFVIFQHCIFHLLKWFFVCDDRYRARRRKVMYQSVAQG